MPLGLPVTAMTTGNVALDERRARSCEATMPTDWTVPKTRAVASVGVIWACRPFLTEARSALPTLASTTQDVVEITTMSALWSCRSGAPLPDPIRPSRSPTRCPEPLPDPLELPTVSPLAMPTEPPCR